MYDPDTVTHVVRCLRKIAADEEEMAYQHKQEAQKTMINERSQDIALRNAEIHQSIGIALRYVAYALEGD
jgi:hypothetical protein